MEGEQAVAHFLESDAALDGIFCSNDTSAISAIQTITKQGKKVPEDIAVVGFSNTPTSLIVSPALTTIDDHAFEMGQAAARLLIRQIDEKQETVASETITIRNDLVVRESTMKTQSN